MYSIKSRSLAGVRVFSSPVGIIEDRIDCNFAMSLRLTLFDMLSGILKVTELELWLEIIPT